MTGSLLPSALALVVLIALHALGGRLHLVDARARSSWLSAFGGVAVAFVFLDLLPALAQAQSLVSERAGGLLGEIERHVYLIAAFGLVFFYWLESIAARSRRRQRREGEGDQTHPGVFWVHMASFGLYNFLIGYLLATWESGGTLQIALYAVAMGLHLLAMDVSLRVHHKHSYHRYGRWLLSALLAVGWMAGHVAPLGELTLALLIAFLAGAIVLNVMKEELPEERQGRIGAFALAAALYGGLLLLVT